jgi:hypothetical protein
MPTLILPAPEQKNLWVTAKELHNFQHRAKPMHILPQAQPAYNTDSEQPNNLCNSIKAMFVV